MDLIQVHDADQPEGPAVCFRISVLLVALVVFPTVAQSPQVERFQRLYDATRPASTDLGVYRLDWVVPLEAAKRQAKTEKRPLLVVAVRNEHGDTFTGYC